jgi:hypothetical protein
MLKNGGKMKEKHQVVHIFLKTFTVKHTRHNLSRKMWSDLNLIQTGHGIRDHHAYKYESLFLIKAVIAAIATKIQDTLLRIAHGKH